MMVAQAMANMASFVIAWAVARGMGDAAYGVFAAAYALATSVASLADSGVRVALIREVARTPLSWKSLWFYALLTSTALAIIVSFAFSVVILLEESAASQALRLWLLGYALLWTGMRISLGVPAGQHRLVAVAVWGAVERIGSAVVVGCIAFFTDASVLQLAQGLCLFELLVLVSVVVWIWMQPWPATSSPMSSFGFTKLALPFGVAAAAQALIGRMDLIVLGFQQAPDVVGHYAAAQLLALAGIFVGVTVAGSLFPALSHLGKKDDVAQARQLIEPAIGLLALVMVLISMTLGVFSESILQLVYGQEFVAGKLWLMLFALLAPFMAVGSMTGAVIGAWGWQGRWARLLWIIVMVVAPSYWLLGSWLGIWGVIAVSAVNQLVMVLFAWHWMSQATLVDLFWLFRLLVLMLVSGLLLMLPGVWHWFALPLSVIGVFMFGLCKTSWLGTALRLVR